MAWATVWQLDRSDAPQAAQARTTLVRLSGRQMKRGVTHTMPALLAGLWNLLAMLELLEQHTFDRDLARFAQVTTSTAEFV